MGPILRLRGVSKMFRLETEARTMYRIIRKLATGEDERKSIWALKDVDLTLDRGEKIGLIGGNGAGKTTLLRVILGIIRPTAGTVELNAKATGFLSLGVGMERDLSVLDNINLFGMIMGMGKDQITERMDAIVEFSGLGEYLHSPLRDLSSGMYQRLAFSIAKESRPDLLVLDEILMGGDIWFQKKALRFFEDNDLEGSSLIFTSHDLGLIERFCEKAVWIEGGKIMAQGPTEEVISMYGRRPEG